jgi:hypothetical protein
MMMGLSLTLWDILSTSTSIWVPVACHSLSHDGAKENSIFKEVLGDKIHIANFVKNKNIP